MKDFKKMPKIFGSSADPEKLALTWKGVLVGLVPLFIIIAGQFGVEASQPELVALIEQLMTVVSAGMVLVGLVRKFYIKFK